MGLTQMLESYAASVKAHTGVHYVPSFNDLNTQSSDDLEDSEVLKRASFTDAAKEPDQALVKKVHNKQDSSWPQFETQDLHKVNRADHTRFSRHTYDMPKGPNGGPSVWEYILHHEKQKGHSIKPMDQDRSSNMPTQGRSLSVSSSAAQPKVQEEAGRRQGSVSSEDEYMDVLTHYGSE